MVGRGEVWLVSLDPTQGSEIRKMRPCVVVSPPEMHDYLRTAIVAPMSTAPRPAPFRIPVTFEGKNGYILLDQLRTVDKTRFNRKLGTVGPGTLTGALATLQEVFAA